MTTRTVDVADLFGWLPELRGRGPVVTSLPDAEELGLPHDLWAHWYLDAAGLCFETSTGPTIFLATDRKRDGRWISKPALIAEAAGSRPLLWHRIVLRRTLGGRDMRRPTYSHLLAYGPGRPGRSRPDVLGHGKAVSSVSAGATVALFVADYLAELGATTVVNPACGYGTFLAAANAHGLDAVGCDVDEARVAAARVLQLDPAS